MTADGSHAKGLTAIVEGFPSNIKISKAEIDKQLARRQMGYGPGGRMKIESDTVEILSGIRFGKTLGSPISMFIKNSDLVDGEVQAGYYRFVWDGRNAFGSSVPSGIYFFRVQISGATGKEFTEVRKMILMR